MRPVLNDEAHRLIPCISYPCLIRTPQVSPVLPSDSGNQRFFHCRFFAGPRKQSGPKRSWVSDSGSCIGFRTSTTKSPVSNEGRQFLQLPIKPVPVRRTISNPVSFSSLQNVLIVK